MKIIYNKTIPFGQFHAINLFGVLFAKGPCNDRVINHESIHTAQLKDFFYVIFYVLYFVEWIYNLLKYRDFYRAYLNISFEREAYLNESDFDYLKHRKHFSSFKYLRVSKI